MSRSERGRRYRGTRAWKLLDAAIRKLEEQERAGALAPAA